MAPIVRLSVFPVPVPVPVAVPDPVPVPVPVPDHLNRYTHPVHFHEEPGSSVLRATSEGHGCLVVFGLSFLLSGLALIAVAVDLLPLDTSQDPLTRVGVALFGSVFVLTGLALMLGRRGLILDRGTGTVVSWIGLLAPMRRRQYALDDIEQVVIDRDSDESVSYPVRLEGGGNPVSVTSSADYQNARATAERLATFLRIPVADRSSGTEVLREWDHLDESLSDRLRRTGEAAPWATPPVGMRCEVRTEAGALVIETPPRGLTPGNVLEIGITLTMVGLAVYFFGGALVRLPWPEGLRWAGLAIVGGLLVALPLIGTSVGVARKAMASSRITASPAMLTVEHHTLGRRTTVEIPGDELEELQISGGVPADALRRNPDGSVTVDHDALRQLARGVDDEKIPELGSAGGQVLALIARFAPGPTITARSDRTSVELGKGLPAEEVRYLYARLLEAIASGV
jgi:hypothetical protein